MGVLHEYIYIIYRHKMQLKCMYIEIYFSHITKKIMLQTEEHV